MNENWFSILARWFCGAMLCFFGFVPAWILYQVCVTLLKEPEKFDWLALLVLVCTAALTYFFALLAYRAFTGNGRKQDGGLLPPWAMKCCLLAFGVIAILCIIAGIYQKRFSPIMGGIAYLAATHGSLLNFGRRMTASESRNTVFSIDPEALGLHPAANEVWGLIIEKVHPAGVVSLVALADGAVSFYFGAGDEMSGFGDYPEPKRVAKELLEFSQDFSLKAQPAKSFPVPRRRFVRFYLLTGSGVNSIEAKEDDLGNQRHPFSPLFQKAGELISEINLVDQKIRGTQGPQD